MNNKRYIIRKNKSILHSVENFCVYYGMIKKYIDAKKIKSSLDRGAFANPHHILDRNIYKYLGIKRDRASFAYGSEAGDYDLRKKICEIENLKHKTSYTAENVIVTAGAWMGVELVIEQLAGLWNGKAKRINIAVIGPTHYQLFHRAINMLGVNLISFDFVIPGKGSVPNNKREILEMIAVKPKAIFITNPNNPNGEYFSPILLEWLISLCKKRGIYIIIDEIQDFFSKNKGLDYGPWIQSENVIRIDSFSKKRGLAEYRVGWILANRHIVGDRLNGITGRLSGLMGNAPRAANTIIFKLLELEKERIVKECPDYFQDIWKSLQKKEEYILKQLKKIKNIDILNREGCINITIRVRNYKKRDLDLAKELMNEGALIMPCSGYGYNENDNIMRITVAERWKKINHSMISLKKVLKKYE